MTLFRILDPLPWTMAVSVLILLFILFSTGGILFIRKWYNHLNFKNHHDVAGFVFTNLGALYAVLLGFTVINVQQRFDRIQEITELEGSYLTELYHDAEVFPEAHRNTIRHAILDYCKSVINEEWPRMVNGQSSPHTVKSFRSIWHAYYALTPSTPKEQTWYAESIGKLNQLTGYRLSRLLGSKESLGPQMWTLLILGGAILVGFVWFFGLENLTSHILMASILAGSTAFFLFLIYSLDSAFSGKVSVAPESLVKLLQL